MAPFEISVPSGCHLLNTHIAVSAAEKEKEKWRVGERFLTTEILSALAPFTCSDIEKATTTEHQVAIVVHVQLVCGMPRNGLRVASAHQQDATRIGQHSL